MAKRKTSSKPSKPKPAKEKPLVVQSELSINDIRGLAWNAVQGNQQSYEILEAQNRKLAKLANNRLRLLKKADLEMFAYDRAKTYLDTVGLKKFSTTLDTSSFSSMVEQMTELISFVNAKTSSVVGARKALKKKLDKISEFTGTEYTSEQAKALGKLLSTDSVSTLLRDIRGDSGEVIEALEDLAYVDADKSELVKIIDTYLQGWTPFDNAPWALKSQGMNYDELMSALQELYETTKNRRGL